MTPHRLNAGPAGANGVASADSAPSAAALIGVPPRAPLPRNDSTIATPTATAVRIGMNQEFIFCSIDAFLSVGVSMRATASIVSQASDCSHWGGGLKVMTTGFVRYRHLPFDQEEL